MRDFGKLVLDAATDPADVVGRVTDARGRCQAELGALAYVPMDTCHDLLGRCEVAGAQECEKPSFELGKRVHLAEDAELVDSGIGARIRHEDEAVINDSCKAVGH